MNKHIRHMLFFMEIVESGSISGAAARIGISKSVISQHLKILETDLGLTLLTRSTRQQELTSAGRQFYKRCREMHDVVYQAWQEARDHQQLAVGSLRISAPHALIGSIVAPAIGDLVCEHEGIVPFLVGNDNRANLIEDKIDLAIRVGKMPSSEYKQKKIGGFFDVLCASPEYLKKNHISPTQMLDSHLPIQKVDYVANSWQGTQITHALKHKNNDEVVKLSFTANRKCNSLPAVVAMARAGCGFAFIPDFVFRSYEERGDLVAVFPEHVCEYAPVYAVYADKGQPPTLVRLAIDAIKKKLQESLEHLST